MFLKFSPCPSLALSPYSLPNCKYRSTSAWGSFSPLMRIAPIQYRKKKRHAHAGACRKEDANKYIHVRVSTDGKNEDGRTHTRARSVHRCCTLHILARERHTPVHPRNFIAIVCYGCGSGWWPGGTRGIPRRRGGRDGVPSTTGRWVLVFPVGCGIPLRYSVACLHVLCAVVCFYSSVRFSW